jgi:hypothetical protein
MHREPERGEESFWLVVFLSLRIRMDRKPKDGSRFALSLPLAFGYMVFRHRDIQAGGD